MSFVPPLPKGFSFQNTISLSNQETGKITSKYLGLRNLGCTCYLNSLLQSLFMTPDFRYNILKWKFNNEIHGSPEDCIPFQLQKLFCRLQFPIRDEEYTTDLTKSFGWDMKDVSYQHDIEELCRVLFEAIQAYLSVDDENFIKTLYEGKSQTVIKCLECNNESVNQETYLDLNLPINNYFEGIKNKSIEMAFMNLIKPEKLEGDNKYFCSKCNKKCDAEKFYRFIKFPKIFFIQLGRFFYDFQIDQRRKIDDYFSFPLVLNLNKYKKSYEEVFPKYDKEKSETDLNWILNDSKELIEEYLKDGPDVYELFSVVIQSGTANGGHYYAYIKSFEDGNWYNFDDTKVYEISKKMIPNIFGSDNNPGRFGSSVTGYYLMYRRVNDGKQFTIEDMTFNEELLNLIKEENEKIKAYEAERKEKMYRITFNVMYNGEMKSIATKKNYHFEKFKEQLREEFHMDSSAPLFCLREYDELNKKPLEYVMENENLTIGEMYLSAYKKYMIQVPDENGRFPVYDPNLITVRVFNYDENSLSIDNSPYKTLTISNRMSMLNLAIEIFKMFGFDFNKRENLIFFKKKYSGNETKFEEIIHKYLYCAEEIHLYNINNGTEIFVEYSPDHKIIERNSNWMKILKQYSGKVLINFTLPGEKTFSASVTVSRYDKVKQVKDKMCEKLSLNGNDIILKDINKEEIFALGDELELYSKKENEMKIFLEYGVPLKENETKIILFYCEYDYEKFNFFPYKITELGDIAITNDKTIGDLKEICYQKLLKERNVTQADSTKVVLRKYSRLAPTTVYNDKCVISDLEFYNKTKIIIQILNKPVDYCGYDLNGKADIKDYVQISLRFLDATSLEMTPPEEIVLNYDDDMVKLCFVIFQHFPQLESVENIDAYKLSAGKYTKLECLCTQCICTELLTFEDTKICKVPLFINKDGYLLVVKDKRLPFDLLPNDEEVEIKNPRSKTPERAKIPSPPPMDLNGNVTLSSRVSQVVDEFEKKGGIPAIKKYSKPKERGVVIKVKGLGEKEGKEEKEEKENNDLPSKNKPEAPIGDNNLDSYPPNESEIEPLV